MLITAEQLKNVCTTLKLPRCQVMADLLNKLGEKYGVVSKDVFHEFLANVIQESGEFSHKEENMYYRPATLMKVWPKRFPTIESTKGYAINPQALANYVYGGRMGNIHPNDGFTFKGAGFIGITGRDTYTKYANYIGVTPEKASELMRTTDEYALDSAYWFFCVLKDLEDEAERDEIIGIIRSINGGLIGKDDRLFYYERVKKFVV